MGRKFCTSVCNDTNQAQPILLSLLIVIAQCRIRDNVASRTRLIIRRWREGRFGRRFFESGSSGTICMSWSYKSSTRSRWLSQSSDSMLMSALWIVQYVGVVYKSFSDLGASGSKSASRSVGLEAVQAYIEVGVRSSLSKSLLRL